MNGSRNARSSRPRKSAARLTRRLRCRFDDNEPQPDRNKLAGRDEIATPGHFVLRQVGHLLRRAYAIARRNSTESLSALGDLSPVQASVLAALARGPLTQATLGRHIGMEPANTHTIVRRMAAAGLIETRRDPGNRRLVLAALTAQGTAIAERLEERVEVATARTLAALNHDEQKAIVNMLARIVLADGAGAPDSEPQDRDT